MIRKLSGFSFILDSENKLLFARYDLDPVAVGITDEVNTHIRIFITDTAHLLMTLVKGFHIVGLQSQVILEFSQIIWFRAVL